MPQDSSVMIAGLVEDLKPVRPLRFGRGVGEVAAGIALTVIFVALMFGIRSDVRSGQIDPVSLIASGLFLILGVAAAVTVVIMGQPRVGNDHSGWKWAAAMAGLLPFSALIIGLAHPNPAFMPQAVADGVDCLVMGSLLGTLTFALLVVWLRRGAPTSPHRAGLVTGVAAGSFGVFAFSFHCIYSDVVHIGLWHSAVVVFGGLVGRGIVPPLVRW